MSQISFFDELVCQLCEKSILRQVQPFSLTSCTHFVCEGCIPNFILLKRCQISYCGKEWIQSKKERVDASNVWEKVKRTEKNIVLNMFPSKIRTNVDVKFYLNSISTYSPIFITQELSESCRNVVKLLGFKLLLDGPKTSFGKIKQIYFEFKSRLQDERLMLFDESFFDSFLKEKMEQLKTLKISDFFDYISSFYVLRGKEGRIIITCRILNKITLLFAKALKKQFNFKLYNETVLKVVDVIRETGYPIFEINGMHELLVKFNLDLQQQNSYLGSEIPWPQGESSIDQIESTEPTVQSLNFYQIQDKKFQQIIKDKGSSEMIQKRKKALRFHQIENLLKFKKVNQKIKSGFSKSSIIQKRMFGFLTLLFPQVKFWTPLLSLKSDINSKKYWRQKCLNQKSTVVFVKSKKTVVGGFTDQGWTSGEDFQTSHNAFLFSMEKEIKYPIRADRTQFATSESYDYLFKFGYLDLSVVNQFQSSENRSEIGLNYEVGDNVDKKYGLFGSSKFAIDEIEVFKVQ